MAGCLDDGQPREARVQSDNGWSVAILVSILQTLSLLAVRLCGNTDSYDSCDVGTFPNQTYYNQSGPEAALQSDASRSKYNYELSWLPGQRLS